MTLLLLDTTFLVDVERGGTDLDLVVGDDDDVAIAAVTVAELMVGVLLASARRRETRSRYVKQVIESIPVLSYDSRVALEHAELLAAVRREGQPRGAHDLLIAATARATGRTIISADRSAFAGLPGVNTAGHR